MFPAEVDLALGWAAEEGWNPGLGDAAAFRIADPQGFLVAEQDDIPLGCISAVCYGPEFGFLGLYIVRPGHRGRGIGMALWRAAMARFAGRSVGLDGVIAQQENYRRSGFAFAHRNIRFALADTPRPPAPSPADFALQPAATLPFAAIAGLDRLCFPVPREAFLHHWLAAPGHVALAAIADGTARGYGVIRPCRDGAKIGPLVAQDDGVAAALFAGLLAAAPPGPVFLDVPEPNTAALALAQQAGMTPVFETARMYTGTAPMLALAQVFGITTFELG
ncbi:GNAT family N-acetyltransferase [Rhodovastum atsumiense]|uniref:GNAT family N-acetyltransferase n=2 Tax=Rhodovastum atsumiense TaxID=504468 RepID=A0A5M6INU3_9PROT|nr:GNAT family N-acetyltransferase [Rhodovastum atsumiense]